MIQRSEKILLLLGGMLFSYLFVQNFIFSQTLEMLAFREIDDLAFQSAIRGIHESMLHFDLRKYSPENTFLRLGTLYDYGYGWTFWFPMVILTFPLSLISQYFDLHIPVIVFPRQLSLLFSFGTAFILYRIVSLYTKNSFLKSMCVLIFFSFVTFVYFSMRFGTVAQTMFFCAWSMYWALKTKKYTFRDILILSILVGLSIGSKLNGLLACPIVGLLFLDRLRNSDTKIWLKSLSLFLGLSLFFSLFFSNPSIFLFPFKKILLTNYIRCLSSYIGGNASTIIPIADLFRKNFLHGIAGTTLHLSILITLTIGLCITAFTFAKKKIFDFIYIIIGFLIVTLYLCLSVKNGASYVSNYFSTISFLIPLGILALEKLPRVLQYSLASIIFFSNIYLNAPLLFGGANTIFSINQYFDRKSKSKEKLALHEILQKKCDIHEDKIIILRDYQTIPIFSGLKKNVFDNIAFENLHLTCNLNKEAPNIIAFWKKSSAFLPPSAFAKLLENKSLEQQESLKENRKFVQKILKGKTFRNVEYQVFFENEEYLYLKKNSKK